MNKSILLSLLVGLSTITMAQDPWVYAKEATDAWPGAIAKATLVLDDGLLTVGEMGLLDIMEGEVYMVKTDDSGNVLWEQSHDKPGKLEVVNRITEVPSDGGFLIATMLIDGYRPWFVKTDDAGNMIWESSAWSDLLGENSVSQTTAYQLPSGDIACVVANDVFRQLNIYVVDNATGNLISTTTHMYETITGVSLFSASTADIINTNDGGFLFATRFGSVDSFFNGLIKIDAALSFESLEEIGPAADNFFAAQININADGSVIVSGSKNIGFIGDNYQAVVATFNAALFYTGSHMLSGGLLHSNIGGISQTPSGDYKMIRYNFSGDSWDMALGDYVEVINVNASFVETGASTFNYAAYNTLEFITALADDQYITGGMAWTIGEPNYFLVIGSGAGDAIPGCIFNCVWPGDADNSGAADLDDILAIGLGYGETGDARDDMSIDWYAHTASAWATELPSGVNHKYTDCNGDGIINEDDTTAVSDNFSFEHAVYTLKTTTGEVPLIFAPTGPLTIGENIIPIILGDATTAAENIYGLRFNVLVNGDDIDAASIKIRFNDSFLGTTDQVLQLTKTHGDISTAYGAIVKTDHENVSGYGEIGTLSFVVIDNIAGKATSSPVELTFENVKAINVSNEELSLSTGNVTIESPTAISNLNAESVIIYPNPVVNDQLHFSSVSSIQQIQIMNMLGEIMLFAVPDFTNTIQLPELGNGQYVIKVVTNEGISLQKLTVLQN